VRFPRATHLVCAFERQEDAQRFYEALGKRLEKFGLELSEEKTRIISFSPTCRPGKTSFDFLGFEFRWGKDRTGKPHVKRRTARKNLRNSLKRFNEWCKKNRHLRLPELFKQLNAKLRGYFNYYGVNGNFASLMLFFYRALKLLMKYLNRRSQRGSYNWAGFQQLTEQFGIVKPHISRRPKRYNIVMSAAPIMA
jgi:RNA-directed DNA polymerase